MNTNNSTSSDFASSREVYASSQYGNIKAMERLSWRLLSFMRQVRADHQGQHRTAYEKNKKKILATQNVCGICGQEIDKGFKYPHPLSPVIDHIVPISKGGHPSDISNLQLAHRWCNRQKADKLMELKKRFKDTSQDMDVDLFPLHFDWKRYKASM